MEVDRVSVQAWCWWDTTLSAAFVSPNALLTSFRFFLRFIDDETQLVLLPIASHVRMRCIMNPVDIPSSFDEVICVPSNNQG